MPEVLKYSAKTLGWQREPGPVRVWRVVEGLKKTEDGKTLRFSIQEIPEDRQIDVLNHMLTSYVRDEPIARNIGAVNNPEILEDFRKLWSFALGQGIVVGAFLVDENNPKPIIAGANMTVISCNAASKGFKTGVQITNEKFQLMLDMMDELAKDTKKIHNGDKYLSAFGLCVDPKFRGQGLAFHLLQARTKIAAACGVQVTSTVFSAPAAKHAAAKAGFQTLVEREFSSFRKKDGSEYFPGIESKSCKLMGKRF